MISARKTIACGAAVVVLFLAEAAPDAPLGLRLVSEAQAVVGAPLTPGSVAGVARRTTRRTVAVVSTEAVAESSAQQAAAQQQAAMAAPPSSGQALPLGMVVSALPAGCSQMTKDGVEYQKCGPNYYRTAFQGSNLVYVTAQP